MLSRRSIPHLLVLTAYSLFTVVLTYPLAWNIGSALPGVPPDTYLYIWNLEWVRRAIFELGVNPYWTQAIYYPTGVSLFYHSLILGNDLLALPLQFTFGSVAAYMVTTLGLIALGGYAAYLLALDLTHRPLAAFFAGFVFTFSPYRFAHLLYSHFDLQPLLWLPLAALAVKKLMDRPGPGRFLLAVVLLFWVSITDWYYALYAFIWLGLYVIYRWSRTHSWRPVATGVLLVLVSVLLLSPLLVPMLQEKDQYPANFRGAEEADKFSADLASYVTPSGAQSIWGGRFYPFASRFLGGPAERTLFLGYVVLALVLVALYHRRGRELYFWLIAGLVFLLLSLGPYLHVGGNSQLAPGGARIPLPYWLLSQAPVLSSLLAIARSISRFGSMVMFCCSMLAAYGLAALLTRLRTRQGYAVALGACALAGLEFMTVPLPFTNTRVPASISVLAADPANFGTLDLPVDYRTGAEAMYFWTVEGKPTTNGYHSRLLPFPFLNDIPSMRSALPDVLPDEILLEPNPSPAEVLAYFNVRYMVLHRLWAPPDMIDGAQQWINQMFGPLTPIAQDNTLALYRLPDTPVPPLVVSIGEGWYPVEAMSDGRFLRWISNDAKILLYANGSIKVDLDVEATALGRARRSRFYLNGKQVYGALIPFDNVRHLTISNLELQPGKNELTIRSLEPAEFPETFGLTPDPRPLSLALFHLAIVPSPGTPGK